MVIAVYEISSLSVPERTYIGSAVDVDKRWAQHLSQLRTKSHHSRMLQRHYERHGVDDLLFSIIWQCPLQDLLRTEQCFIDMYAPYFNSRHRNVASQLGVRHSAETRARISASKKGSDFWSGRKHSDASKEKMRSAKLGKKLSLETRQKLSIARMGNKNTVGNKNRLGKPFSDDARMRISEGLKRYYASKRERVSRQ